MQALLRSSKRCIGKEIVTIICSDFYNSIQVAMLEVPERPNRSLQLQLVPASRKGLLKFYALVP